MKKNLPIYIASGVLIVLFILGLIFGSALLSLSQIWEGLTGQGKLHLIVYEYRLPRVLTAILAGAALSTAGLLMQSYFRNALAGPYILGVSSGAGLGVALLIFSGSFFAWDFAMNHNMAILFSILGSAVTLSIVMLLSKKIGNGAMLLITGLMIASFASAIISIFQYFAPDTLIKNYLLWTMGSLGDIDLSELLLFGIIILLFIVLSKTIANPLNAFLLGNEQAQSLGVDIHKTKWMVMIIAGVLAGIVTAYCGPIAFIGLTGPHLARLILRSQNHHLLIPFSALIGAIVLLLCNIIAQLPGFNFQLPINAVTSIIGAPIVVAIILNRSKNAI